MAAEFWSNEHAAPDKLSATQVVTMAQFYGAYAFLRYVVLPAACERCSPTYRKLPPSRAARQSVSTTRAATRCDDAASTRVEAR